MHSDTRKFFSLRALAGALCLPFLADAECKREAVDLPVTISGTRALTDAKINHQDVRLMVDSGAFFSMLSAAKADELKLKRGPAPYGLELKGVGGATDQPSIALAKPFTIAGVDIPSMEFLVGGSEIGDGSDGLIGQNFLIHWNVEYDLAKGAMRLFKDTDCSKQFLAYWVLQTHQPYTLSVIEKVTPRNPHAVAHAYINGEKIRVLFDSGASRSFLSQKAAARAGIKVDSPGVTDGGAISGVGRNLVLSYIAPFASLKFGDGGEEVKNARLRIADIDFGMGDMLLGADFFLSHRIFIANTQDKVYFTYNGGPVFDLRNTSKPAASDQASDAKEPKPPSGEPEDAAVLARRGTASAGRGDNEHALADLTRAIELTPNNSEYHFERAQVLLRLKEPQKALDDLNAALELKPDSISVLLTRAQLRIDMRYIPEAHADLDTVDRIASKQADARFILALEYLRADLWPPVITQFELWMASHGEDSRMAIALSGRCKAKAMLGQDLAAALKDCNAAIRRGGKIQNPDFLENLALVRFRLGDYDKSIESYDAALKIRPKTAWTLYGRGLAKLKKNDRGGGEADIAEAVAIAPGVAQIYEKMGLAP